MCSPRVRSLNTSRELGDIVPAPALLANGKLSILASAAWDDNCGFESNGAALPPSVEEMKINEIIIRRVELIFNCTRLTVHTSRKIVEKIQFSANFLRIVSAARKHRRWVDQSVTEPNRSIFHQFFPRTMRKCAYQNKNTTMPTKWEFSSLFICTTSFHCCANAAFGARLGKHFPHNKNIRAGRE